jgi:ferrochelatase
MSQAKTGILLANLGTPEAPTSDAVKRYLRQFLSDTRVVDFPRLLWWPLLRGVILPIRSPRVAKLYQSVWMEEGSPLMVYSRRQEKALAARLPDMPVALGMSYGKPSLESAVDHCWRRAWTISWCWRSTRSTPARRWPPSGTSWRAFWRPAAAFRA